MRPYDVRDVGSDGTVTWTLNPPAVAIELCPSEGNRGGFPVKVAFNPDDASSRQDVVIVGPHGEPPVGVDVIHKVTLSGLPVGDKWQLLAAESDGDRRRLVLRTDQRGFLAMGAPPPTTLFDFDIHDWGPALTNQIIYMDPVLLPAPDAPLDPRDFRGVRFHDPGDTYDRVWDLSCYKGFRLVAQLPQITYPADSLRPFVELMAREAMPKNANDELDPGLFVFSGERIYMGTSGNFGIGTGNLHGVIQLGAGGESVTATRTITSEWSPFVRIGVELAGGTFPRPNADAGAPNDWAAVEWLANKNGILRLTATAW